MHFLPIWDQIWPERIKTNYFLLDTTQLLWFYILMSVHSMFYCIFGVLTLLLKVSKC